MENTQLALDEAPKLETEKQNDDKQITVSNTNVEVASFANFKATAEMYRIASQLSKSSIIPKEYQNNDANCMIALDIANRINMSPMMVMQSLYIVHGKPSWSGSAVIAIINGSRRYREPLKFKLEGKGDDLSCYAYTTNLEGEEIRGATITMAMVKAEGWNKSKGGMTSKWLTMPEQMMMYRSATFFGRTYCPDLLLGMPTESETEDIRQPQETAYNPFEEAQNA